MTTPRTTKRVLAALSAELSARDKAVLHSVAAHRFLTTNQLERMHFTDHATPLAAARICRRVLQRLHQQRILHRLERRIGGVHAGSTGFVWSIGVAGDRLLQQETGAGVRRRQHEPSTTFLKHTLAVAEAHVQLTEASRDRRFDLIAVDLEPACWRTLPGSAGSTQRLRPDLYVVTGKGDYEDCWFVEIDCGTESLPRLLRKCAAYEQYRRSGREQASLGTFPLVVWVLSSAVRLQKLQAEIARTRGLDSAVFRLTLTNDFTASLAAGPEDSS
jgi:hypothetical protein